MDIGGGPMFGLWWQILNLLVLLGVVLGFTVLIISVWKQAKAQESMAAAFQEIAAKLNQQSDKIV
ncbi:MAG: hypothetical protein ACM3NT_11915 [Methylocystaceae bacterium]